MLSDIIIPTFVTLFVVIDPVGLMPMYLSLTPNASARERVAVAWRSIVTAFLVLLIFALLGKSALAALGISLPAFRIAGGLLLFLIAVEMLFEKRTERRQRNAAAAEEDHAPAALDDDVAYFPLGIPLIAGPGAITTMILLNSRHTGDYATQATIIAVMAGVLLLTLFLFLLSTRLEKLAGETFTKIVTRILGIILGALAVEFVLTGLAEAGLVAYG